MVNEQASVASELKDIEKRLSVLRGILRAYLSEKENPAIFDKTIGFHQEQIDFHSEQISIIKTRQNGNGHHIDDMRKSIGKASTVRARLKHARAIEKLLKLYKEIHEDEETEDDNDE